MSRIFLSVSIHRYILPRPTVFHQYEGLEIICKRDFETHNKFVPLHLRLKVTLDQIHHVHIYRKVQAIQEIVAILALPF